MMFHLHSFQRPWTIRSFSKRYVTIVKSPTTAYSAEKASRIFSKDCMDFLETLQSRTQGAYEKAMAKRKAPVIVNYREDTEDIRKESWTCWKIPPNLQSRHVEMTGPANSVKMMKKSLESSANGYMADMEDSMSPQWGNIVDAQDNLYRMARGTLGIPVSRWSSQKTFFLRPRGLHMTEKRFDPCLPGTLVDVGTHLFHNAHLLQSHHQGPFLYLPKMENYEDAMYVSELLLQAETLLTLPRYSIKTTALIETLPAIFQTHEIVYALRHRMTALNCGRWDYIFSLIKHTSQLQGSAFQAPLDRSMWAMEQPFLEKYVEQIVDTCRRRGLYPMGGMSACLPSKDPLENDVMMENVYQDKLLEIQRGCQGAWVAHPHLIEPIQQLFQKVHRSTFVVPFSSTPLVVANDVMPSVTQNEIIPPSIEEDYMHIDNHISIITRYISSYLNGKGAVAIQGMMEDLATVEMSSHLLRHNVHHHPEKEVRMYIRQSLEKMEHERIRDICRQYILEGCYEHLGECIEEQCSHDEGYLRFDPSIIGTLRGRFPDRYLTGIDLTKYRGEFMNQYWESNGFQTPYRFLGTTNGISAVNVVAGGQGQVGPYVGGWQTNAMKNRLGMLLPDTLHVSPEEAATCAKEINYHLHRADCVEVLQNKNDSHPKKDHYYALSMLADMEQGWNTPEKIRISVKLAIENGINMIHIEDQGDKKRCGHLGDKELNTYDDYALILRSANLAAQEILGPEQSHRQFVRFIARTDAYSAKRIHHSQRLYSPHHPEHKYIDWEKGTSPDGKYLYLKQGINPDTGRRWGMELSIDRCARVVDEGLASHVWMETPDADLQVAKDFMEGVNTILSRKQKKAFGLYNHSPSFDWDVKFMTEATLLAQTLTDFIIDQMRTGHWKFYFKDHGIQIKDVDTMLDQLQKELVDKGSIIQGDDRCSRECLMKILVHGLDAFHGETRWRHHLSHLGCLYHSSTSSSAWDISEYIHSRTTKGFNPTQEIARLLVDQRLANFSDQLASFGYNLHLITLPEFHVTAFHMHQLSRAFSESGIHAFVTRIQRPERELMQKDETYTYYKHQSATGTGVEAYFNECVGSHNTKILDESTETDDIKKRKEHQ